MRKFQSDLSASSLAKLASDFKAYVSSLDYKCELLVRRLIEEVGLTVVQDNMNAFKGDSEKSYNTFFELHRYPDKGAYGKLVIENEDILFIEFGSGIYYNNGNSHPQAKEFGYGIGTYPGQKNAINPGYWWYKDDNDNLRFSLGTEATMPVYKAYAEMISKVGIIAREVFGNG